MTWQHSSCQGISRHGIVLVSTEYFLICTEGIAWIVFAKTKKMLGDLISLMSVVHCGRLTVSCQLCLILPWLFHFLTDIKGKSPWQLESPRPGKNVSIKWHFQMIFYEENALNFIVGKYKMYFHSNFTEVCSLVLVYKLLTIIHQFWFGLWHGAK